jgi:hypothetical protein
MNLVYLEKPLSLKKIMIDFFNLGLLDLVTIEIWRNADKKKNNNIYKDEMVPFLKEYAGQIWRLFSHIAIARRAPYWP